MISMLTDKKNQAFSNLEIWGGVECTINRVGDEYRDQLLYAGHYTRPGDIDAFAALGIKVLRYPVLWEHHQPEKDKEIDWGWAERQLEQIRKHDIIPVIGLVHHGSGPKYVDLYSDDFAHELAAYAEKVARRFPWAEYFTPVNEPLTTARFSGMYGLWYPHHKDPYSFAKMLLNELKATVLAMKAIRKINPQAKLVQTEDLAKIHSTPLLKYQADFENERRWLSFDILCGRVNRQHGMWKYLSSLGIKEEMLGFFLENVCMPDIMGFNYYVTSERYLDENVEKYPSAARGGNGRHSYADVEAVRVITPSGLRVLLHEAWDRYHLPVAITEAHLSCTREEQMRWLNEVWGQALQAQKEGVDVRAVTAWALLGAYDWNSLLTQYNNHYERGVFEVRGHELRSTCMTKLVRDLADSGCSRHPLLEGKGWWHRKNRFLHCSGDEETLCFHNDPAHSPLLIIGKNGTLGRAFAKVCTQRGIHHRLLSRAELDITDPLQVERAINLYKPWAIINAAGYVRVDEAEAESEVCFMINACGPEFLARACRKHGLQFLTFSSDLVFNGNKQLPYTEGDKVEPLSIYGKSKAQGEKLVADTYSSALVVRTSAFFGPWDRYNFAHHVLETLKNEQSCDVVNDVFVSPTYVPDLVNASLDLMIDEASGIWHLSNEGSTSWAGFAEELAERAGYSKKKLIRKTLEEMEWRAPRPSYSVLESNKGIKLPLLENAIHRYFEEQITETYGRK